MCEIFSNSFLQFCQKEIVRAWDLRAIAIQMWYNAWMGKILLQIKWMVWVSPDSGIRSEEKV